MGGDALAQGAPALDVQRFEPPGMISGFATVWTARQLPRGRVGFEILGDYAHRVLQDAQVDTTGHLHPGTSRFEHLTALHMRLAVSPVDWFQIGLSSPVVQFVTAGPGFVLPNPTRTTTVGYSDVQLDLGFRPIAEERGAGLAFNVFVSVPSGSRSLLLTDGVPTFGARMAISAAPNPVHIGAHVGYRVRPGGTVFEDRVAVDDSLSYGAGLGFLLYRDVVRLNVEGVGETTVGPALRQVTASALTSRLHTALEVNGNLRISDPSGFMFMLGAGAGLTPAPGSPNARAFVGFGFVPEDPPDWDHDGIVNFDDLCKRDPEDDDGFEDDDGCPDLDNDADGLPDVDDECPDDAEDPDGFEDGDGCPDHDNDHDRVPDEDDRCPNEPEDRDRFQDADGCPDDDNDGDGILDARDKCPNVPEDRDGFSDSDGCPEEELDRDADGVIDNFDPCPDDPEDTDGFQDDDGCPEYDNDEDHILDVDDLCPNEPEVVNGNADEDGCPDETMAVLKGDRIVILEKVHFYVNDSKIRPESYGVLDAVVATLLQHPEVARLRVEGHTDSDGSDTYNQQLSERRAASVRLYLVEHGVAADRLESQGYGELFPIAPNRTAEGREMNRRVEFVVVPPDAP
ncbi:MAG TPA: OmpA family protein [Myxococcota bacterium]|nr:OmpA family protein [Myxococcota bacterium]